MRHVFGPVLSRRLGRSLGLDVTPAKVCTLDCVYCQIRPTDTKTLERRAWVDSDAVIAECRAFFTAGGEADAVTFAGSGEPTLHIDLGRMIREIRAFAPCPVAVITNGTLLFDPAVRRDLLAADLVMPNIDAGDEVTFARLNRPAAGLAFARVLDGLAAFAAEFRGTLLLEVFLVPGYNCHRAALEAIADAIRRLPRFDGIDLNAARRPSRVEAVRLPNEEEFALAEEILSRVGPVTSLRDPAPPRAVIRRLPLDPDRILATLARHPMTSAELALAFGATTEESEAICTRLAAEGRLLRLADGIWETV